MDETNPGVSRGHTGLDISTTCYRREDGLEPEFREAGVFPPPLPRAPAPGGPARPPGLTCDHLARTQSPFLVRTLTDRFRAGGVWGALCGHQASHPGCPHLARGQDHRVEGRPRGVEGRRAQHVSVSLYQKAPPPTHSERQGW